MGLMIIIETEVNPTEDVEKVKNAIRNLFPDANCEFSGDKLRCETESIENFATLLKEQRIRDAARGVLIKNLHGNRIVFFVSKQVATVGKISFSVGDVPLGDIKIEITGDSLPELIDHIAPDTRVQKQSRN